MNLFARYRKPLAVAGISALALAVRYPLRNQVSGDMVDFLLPWYGHIVQRGARALGDAFSNYTPPYTYLLWLASCLHSHVPAAIAIKAISIAFDFVAAFVMYRLVRQRYHSGPRPWLAYAAVLLAPTVVVNGSWWGQCDVIYSACLLAAIHFACARKPLPLMLSFAIAFSFKAQAMFLAPFILMLLLKGQIPWRYTLSVPIIYLLVMLPSVVEGRSLLGLLTIYLRQASAYRTIWGGAPNLYVFLYGGPHNIVMPAGLAIGALAGLWIAGAAWRSKAALGPELLLKGAALSVALMPFLLPKMHDRYFFPADLISIGLAFYSPELIAVPLLFQLTSLCAYAPFLLHRYAALVVIGGFLNLIPIGMLLWSYTRALFPRAGRVVVAGDEGP